MVRTLNGLALCVCVCASYLARPEHGEAQAPDPNLVYRTLQTPHFEITYHEPLGPLATRLAAAAEHANSVLSRSLGYEASERTLILLTDDSDEANGVAGVIPRNEIHLFAAAPEDLSTVADYDDWITTLVTHEHTHVLHLDQIGGVSAVINAILGKTVAPNALQPRWFIEGLATYAESAHTSGGRMHSSQYDMMLRMDVLDERVLTLAQLSNDPVRWPHGEIRYLYGSRFVAFIAKRYGQTALNRIGLEYGKALLPYGLNRAAKRATGATFVELYDQFREDLRAQHRTFAARLQAAGLIEGRLISAHADLVRGPRYLRDGRIGYFADDGFRPPQLRTLDGEQLTETSGEARFSPHPDGESLIYAQIAPVRDIYAFQDLFRLELATGESERLTEGLRASQPDVAPDGRSVAFVTQKAGSSRIELAELSDVSGTRRTLYESAPFDQVYTPRFSPDGRSIALSAWRRGGYRDILLLDVATGAVRELTHDRALDTGPSFSPDGRRVYFSSDRTGVANVYTFDLTTGQISQLTNVLGGAFQPESSPDGTELIYVDYGSRGFGLRSLPLHGRTAAPAPPFEERRGAPPRIAAAHQLHSRPYSPWPTLWPNNYRLELGTGGFGTELAVSVYGQDLAAFHNYGLRVSLPLEELEPPDIQLRYTYQRTPLAPSILLFRQTSLRDDLEVGGRERPWVARQMGATLGVAYRFADIRRSQTLELDYSITHVGKARGFDAPLDPNEPGPELPELGVIPSAGFGYRYSDVLRNPYDISPSQGRSFGVHIDVTDPIFGRDMEAASVRWDVRQFVAMPWAKAHVLAAHYGGGLAGGDSARIARFTLGGFPQHVQFPSLYDIAVLGALPSIGGVALRGYPPAYRAGTQFHQLQIEYRFPLLDLEWGAYTLPLYLRRAWLNVFTDVGDAYQGALEPENLLWGSGVELFVSFVLAYRAVMALRIGLARGWVHGGITQFYVHLGSQF